MTGLNLHFSSFNVNERGHLAFSIFFFASFIMALIIPSIDENEWEESYTLFLKIWYLAGFSFFMFFYYFVYKLKEIHNDFISMLIDKYERQKIFKLVLDNFD
mmetsp:Transcript_32802/g.50084  ORF Transcript_32802/g.50084 Transcript_32802/m.50084 type:complete len:102 (+) Transcript_32802:452-757(+)